MSIDLLKGYPVKNPSIALTKIWGDFSLIFTNEVQVPEALSNTQPLTIDHKEVLVEVPSEKQGIHPHQFQNKQQHQQQFKQGQIQRQPQKKQEIFQKSGLCDDPDKKAWFYINDEKKNEGPFTSKEMDTLMFKNIIDTQTRVALDSLEKFVRIEKIVKMYNANQKSQPQAQPPQASQEVKKVREHQILTPFTLSGFTADYNVQNEVQGPLNTVEMDNLWKTSQINEDTLVAFENTKKFHKVEKILKIASEQSQPKQQEVKKEEPKNKVEAVKPDGDKKQTEKEQKPQGQGQVKAQEQEQQSDKKVTQQAVQQPQPVKIEPVQQQVQVQKKPAPLKEKEPKKVILKAQQKVEEEPQQEPQHEDEWQTVVPVQVKKKVKKTITAEKDIPGFSAKPTNNQPAKAQLPAKSPIVETTNVQNDQEEQAQEDDEWQEVDIKKNKKK